MKRQLSLFLGCVFLLSLAAGTDVAADEYVIGGRTATPGQFPYIVSLRTRVNVHFCGGFILSDRWIGTAASCIPNALMRPGLIRIGVGAHTRFDGQIVWSDRVVRHPRFNRRTLDFDIAVIHTRTQIPLNNRARPIRWPTNPNLQNGQSVRLIGWGLDHVS